MLVRYRQTVGKMIMHIIVASRSNEPVSTRSILLREVFGKWGITIALPMMLGLILLGNSWLPTVIDILIMLLVIIVGTVYYIFTKHLWYEHLSGLSVKPDMSSKKATQGFYILTITAILGIGLYVSEYKILHRIPCRLSLFQNINSTKPYVRFLKKQNTNPVDYVLGLFDKYDVVVLCERDHPEMTQWDFIYDVIRNPAFIDKVGNVFTEYGHIGMQDFMNKFMATDSLDEKEVHEHILQITRNMPVHPAWTGYNWYNYLNRLYNLNQTLSPEKRIQHHFTDAAVDWSAITTTKDYEEYEHKYLWNRDKIMAENLIAEMKRLSNTAKKPLKCLVVMNYRHAMDFTDGQPNIERINTYEYLKDSLGNRAVNVLINSRILGIYPVAGGVWDAAFEETGYKPVGFNFQGTPFGSDRFDMFPIAVIKSTCIDLRYRDVFTGFVYTHPLKEQYYQTTTPGYFDGFEKEYIRRCSAINEDYREAAVQDIESAKIVDPDFVEKYSEFKYETILELFFYGFFSIGLLTGFIAYLFRRSKS